MELGTTERHNSTDNNATTHGGRFFTTADFIWQSFFMNNLRALGVLYVIRAAPTLFREIFHESCTNAELWIFVLNSLWGATFNHVINNFFFALPCATLPRHENKQWRSSRIWFTLCTYKYTLKIECTKVRAGLIFLIQRRNKIKLSWCWTWSIFPFYKFSSANEKS